MKDDRGHCSAFSVVEEVERDEQILENEDSV